MKSAVRVTCLLFVILLLFSGCGEAVPQESQTQPVPSISAATVPTTAPVVVPKPMPYTLKVENGQYFMEFTEKAPSFSGSQSIFWPEFSSVKEMKNAIMTGRFSGLEMEVLRTYAEKNEKGDVLICDVDNISEPVLPAEFSLDRIVWRGLNYTFYYYTENDGSIYIRLHNPERDKEMFEKYYANYQDHHSVLLTGQDVEPERNATVYYYESPSTKLKQIQYVIQSEEKTYYVNEYYATGRTDGSPSTTTDDHSDTVPRYVQVWGTDKGVEFYAMIDIDERPSMELLSQIGIRKYVETETE